MENQNFNVVRLHNDLVYKGSYHLPVRALKTLCFLVAKYVDPRADELPSELHVPLTEIVDAIKQNEGATWKSIYQEVDAICRDLTSNPIHFSEKVEIKGTQIKGYVNWCSSAVPYRDENGNVYIRFGFDKLLSQFLLGLAEYVRLYRPELNRLKRSYGIRLFQMLKGIRNKREKYERVSRERYELEKLRFLFALGDKYAEFKDFNKRVLKPATLEINEKTSVQILDVKPIRRNRRIVALEFVFTDQELNGSAIGTTVSGPSKEELETTLTFAQHKAYTTLIKFGVTPGIAFRRILPSVKGGVVNGYEDKFVEFALIYFKTNAKKPVPGAFVKWWTGQSVFSPNREKGGGAWAEIHEQVVTFKAGLEGEDGERFWNREEAKDLTYRTFKSRFVAAQ